MLWLFLSQHGKEPISNLQTYKNNLVEVNSSFIKICSTNIYICRHACMYLNTTNFFKQELITRHVHTMVHWGEGGTANSWPWAKGAPFSPQAAQFNCKYYLICQHILSVCHKKEEKQRKYTMKQEAAYRVMWNLSSLQLLLCPGSQTCSC